MAKEGTFSENVKRGIQVWMSKVAFPSALLLQEIALYKKAKDLGMKSPGFGLGPNRCGKYDCVQIILTISAPSNCYEDNIGDSSLGDKISAHHKMPYKCELLLRAP